MSEQTKAQKRIRELVNHLEGLEVAVEKRLGRTGLNVGWGRRTQVSGRSLDVVAMPFGGGFIVDFLNDNYRIENRVTYWPEGSDNVYVLGGSDSAPEITMPAMAQAWNGVTFEIDQVGKGKRRSSVPESDFVVDFFRNSNNNLLIWRTGLGDNIGERIRNPHFIEGPELQGLPLPR